MSKMCGEKALANAKMEYMIDLESVWRRFDESARVDLISTYCETIQKCIIDPMVHAKTLAKTRVTLSGRAPVWLYLTVAHYLHGKVYRLWYSDGKGLQLPIFDHTP